ncbi:hypothetical protein, partial [Luteitalea sp.]|uniref:hypothetical protein n=1 Tax=Luteitalea sp. TaxID=2004800 RepID=UPI0025B81AB9
LAAIDAVIYGRVTDDVQRVMIAGRQIDKIPILELFAIKSRLERQVSRARGGSSASTTYARFG